MDDVPNLNNNLLLYTTCTFSLLYIYIRRKKQDKKMM